MCPCNAATQHSHQRQGEGGSPPPNRNPTQPQNPNHTALSLVIGQMFLLHALGTIFRYVARICHRDFSLLCTAAKAKAKAYLRKRLGTPMGQHGMAMSGLPTKLAAEVSDQFWGDGVCGGGGGGTSLLSLGHPNAGVTQFSIAGALVLTAAELCVAANCVYSLYRCVRTADNHGSRGVPLFVVGTNELFLPKKKLIWTIVGIQIFGVGTRPPPLLSSNASLTQWWPATRHPSATILLAERYLWSFIGH